MSTRLVCLMLVLASCGMNEKEDLRSEVDSLRTELVKSYETSQALAEIGIWLDSIDAARQLLRIDLVEGTPYSDYNERMRGLRDYVTTTEQKIEELQNTIQTSSVAARALTRTINQLKSQLASRQKEISFLQEQVEDFRHKNETLMITVDLQDAEIADKQEQIEAKSQELALIEARVQELMIQAKVSEADAYFMRAMAIETAANRTRLAPRKKKETLAEAIELYKKALSLGKTEASAKIEELEGRL